MNVFEVHAGRIDGPDGRLLDAVDLALPDGAVTVVLGPAGTGKSHLLAALAGAPPGEGWRLEGAWLHRGRDARLSHADGSIAWMRQCPARRVTSAPLEEATRALASNAGTVLLDEPTARAAGAEVEALARVVQAQASAGRALVVITHDLAFARRIADHVCLVVNGGVVVSAAAGDFFEEPTSPLVRRFLREGNCWPVRMHVAPPSHFRWVIPEQLAGMGRPGLLGEEEDDLAAIAASGITTLVSLTEQALPAQRLRPFGITGRHFPIVDMAIPALGPTARLCRDIEREIGDGQRVAVHCHAGLGRTGTILASFLVWRGLAPEAAIAQVRAVHHGYLQTSVQLSFVRRFAEEARQ